MLVAAAGAIRVQCRADDIIARIGGDEFAILLPRIDAAAAAAIAECIATGAAKEKVMGMSLSISLGWASKSHESEPMFQVIKDAEDHMYKEKLKYKTAHRGSVVKVLYAALLLECECAAVHARRVSQLCVAVSEAYGLGKQELEELAVAGELHDIGKIAVPKGLIEKTGALSEAEWEEMRRHAESGYRLLNILPEYAKLSEYVLAHHERWNGSGYPKGLSGQEIPWVSRVIAVTDAYETMTAERPYREAVGGEEAARELIRCMGAQFDPDITRIFVTKVIGLTM